MYLLSSLYRLRADDCMWAGNAPQEYYFFIRIFSISFAEVRAAFDGDIDEVPAVHKLIGLYIPPTEKWIVKCFVW